MFVPRAPARPRPGVRDYNDAFLEGRPRTRSDVLAQANRTFAQVLATSMSAGLTPDGYVSGLAVAVTGYGVCVATGVGAGPRFFTAASVNDWST